MIIYKEEIVIKIAEIGWCKKGLKRMIDIAVCDDEMTMAGQIDTLLQKFKSKYHIALNVEVFSDGLELEKRVKEGVCYDIIYMDIEMKYKNGLDTSKEIRKFDKVSMLIYVTSHDNYMPETFEYRPFRFIIKPINLRLFELSFLKAYEEIVECDFYFQYRYNRAYCKLLVQKIMYFESQKRTIGIICSDSEKKFYGKLNNVESTLKETKARFLRIHQSFLVNYKYIEELAYDKVTLTNGTILTISEDKRKQISEQYCNIIGSGSICL